MSEYEYVVVDLGCKKGGALDVYRKAGPTLYKYPEASRGQCLGVDVKDQYQPELQKRRYKFQKANVLEDFTFPRAEVYLAFDFLEHLPSIEAAQQVLHQMLESSNKGVWLRCPSFEDEPRLTDEGLRFTWTRWHGHRAHFKLEHVYESLALYRATSQVSLRHKIKFGEMISSSADKRIVPIDAPEDTTRYNPKLGKKPNIGFRPPLVGQYEILTWKED